MRFPLLLLLFLSFLPFLKPLAAQTPCEVSIRIQGDSLPCYGGFVNLKAEGSQWDGTYEWLGTSNTNAVSTFPLVGDTTLYVRFTHAATGCVAEDSITVSPRGFRTELVSIPANDSIELGEVVELQAVNIPNNGPFTYEWKRDNTLMVGANSPYFTASVNTNDQRMTITTRVRDAQGCDFKAEKTFVIIQPLIIRPNAFLPGSGDPENSTFRLEATQGTIKVENMQIYNQWGGLIFEGEGNNAVWNGESNGQPQPTGLYYYIAKIRKGKEAALGVLHGEITLIR